MLPSRATSDTPAVSASPHGPIMNVANLPAPPVSIETDCSTCPLCCENTCIAGVPIDSWVVTSLIWKPSCWNPARVCPALLPTFSSAGFSPCALVRAATSAVLEFLRSAVAAAFSALTSTSAFFTLSCAVA